MFKSAISYVFGVVLCLLIIFIGPIGVPLTGCDWNIVQFSIFTQVLMGCIPAILLYHENLSRVTFAYTNLVELCRFSIFIGIYSIKIGADAMLAIYCGIAFAITANTWIFSIFLFVQVKKCAKKERQDAMFRTIRVNMIRPEYPITIIRIV